MISLNIEKTFGFISKEKVFAYEAEVKAAQEMLEKGTGKGNDFLGWLHLPSSITKEHLADLNATAKVLRDNCEVVIVAGIGGSYLGARAVIEALSNSFTWLQEKKTGEGSLSGERVPSPSLLPERPSFFFQDIRCRQAPCQLSPAPERPGTLREDALPTDAAIAQAAS